MGGSLGRVGTGERIPLTGKGLPDSELPQASCPVAPALAIPWIALSLYCSPSLALCGCLSWSFVGVQVKATGTDESFSGSWSRR